ncbi:MAG: 50S ribosomal protein L18 [Deltaproteobacteria bacterium]|jgi:large subunit ribosomal protein L18|nr:50S ribosomal protein L18 [Deltaproteobacteria bacterium]
MANANPRLAARGRRRARVRKKILGTGSRPRLCVFRSASHIYAQLIDDEKGVTLASASTLTPSLREPVKGKKKTEMAKLVGLSIGETIKNLGYSQIIFDRNGFLYHGRVMALSEGAREAGLKF